MAASTPLGFRFPCPALSDGAEHRYRYTTPGRVGVIPAATRLTRHTQRPCLHMFASGWGVAGMEVRWAEKYTTLMTRRKTRKRCYGRKCRAHTHGMGLRRKARSTTRRMKKARGQELRMPQVSLIVSRPQLCWRGWSCPGGRCHCYGQWAAQGPRPARCRHQGQWW